MKSPARQGSRRVNTQPVTVVNNTKYITKISENIIPKRHYTLDGDASPTKLNRFLNLYGIICLYILLIFGIIIGGGGIAVCIVYFNSEENTQNWKIGGIVLGGVTCIVTLILMILTIFKQTRNQPWRYQVKDILLRPEHYFHGDLDQFTSDDEDDISDQIDQTVDTTLSPAPTPSIGCNRLHSSTEECIKPPRTPNTLPPLRRSRSLRVQWDSSGPRKVEEFENEYSLANETQTNVSGNTTDNLILRRVPTVNAKGVTQQSATKIMIVRVPKVPGELVIQPKEH